MLPPPRQALPSAAAALESVSGPPEFLDPEATRPLASLAHDAYELVDGRPAIGGGTATRRDVSSLAPALKQDKALSAGVVASGAVRYKGDAVSDGDAGARRPEKTRIGSKPMGVQDFLEQGVGGAQLPRSQQDRKDREKEKRSKGQSTHAVWKSEAEMLLRQQYD
jgi:hypothetical protein